jgi:four helix bundle protein
MGKIERFEDIEAWKEARMLTKQIYELTEQGRFAKDFGLRDQMRRAAVSIMSNIAEGFERDGDKEFGQFLSLAKGSVGELRAQVYVALDAGYIKQDQFDHLTAHCIRVSRLLAGFMKYLRLSGLGGVKYRSPGIKGGRDVKPET